MSKDVVKHTITFVKETLAGAEGGHDWFHMERVWKTAKYIQRIEDRGDPEIIELAALLHDISDPKFNDGDEEKGSQLAYNFLIRQGLQQQKAEHIQKIIRYVSFKGGFKQVRINSIEFQMVQDADRLDAMGAIGIARAFNYGGFKNRPLYNPDVPLQEYENSAAYHKSEAPTINHFYEKLLKLRDLMNTPTGKLLAEERHSYMLEFLDRFYKESDPEQVP